MLCSRQLNGEWFTSSSAFLSSCSFIMSVYFLNVNSLFLYCENYACTWQKRWNIKHFKSTSHFFKTIIQYKSVPLFSQKFIIYTKNTRPLNFIHRNGTAYTNWLWYKKEWVTLNITYHLAFIVCYLQNKSDKHNTKTLPIWYVKSNLSLLIWHVLCNLGELFHIFCRIKCFSFVICLLIFRPYFYSLLLYFLMNWKVIYIYIYGNYSFATNVKNLFSYLHLH